MTDITDRARRYLATVEPAISGSGGRPATYKAAVALRRGFDLPPETALPLLLEWNSACSPPWSERDLRAFLRGAEKSRRPPGYLLSGPPARAVDPAEEKRRKRQSWPAMRKLTEAEAARVAELRGVSPDAVLLLHSSRCLRHCLSREGEECFVIRDGPGGAFAQRRRFDGQPCALSDGSRVKALNLPGSEGSFLQPFALGNPDVPILLTEGAVSLLESCEAVLRAEALSSVSSYQPITVMAAVSASSRFTAETLSRLSGRRVRIYSDADKAGQDAAARWTASLRAAGCVVDNILPPVGCKDLGDALRRMPAGHPYWLKLLTF